MIAYALPLLIAGLAGITNETIDRVLLKYLLPNTETASSELGLYGAFYKLSIIMILFIQTFRFAAEPFFFAQKNSTNSKKIYADVMKYFTIITAIVFLIATVFYDLIKQFLGSNYHDERGFLVVSILLLANLFLGIYHNLSVWYKLTDKTRYGMYFSILGAALTIALNWYFIPLIGFMASAYTTVVAYGTMMLISYFYGQKYYQIPYNVSRISMYLLLATSGALVSFYFFRSNYGVNSIIFLAFMGLTLLLEQKELKAILGRNKK